MKRKPMMEHHFWELFAKMDADLFIVLAGVSEDMYDRLSRYYREETKRRPMSLDKLLKLREDLLDRLDDYERDNELGVIA